MLFFICKFANRICKSMTTRHYNLQEINDLFHIEDTFGAIISCMTTDRNLITMLPVEGISLSCYSIVLIVDGRHSYEVDNDPLELDMHDLMILPPHCHITYHGSTQEVNAVHLLIDAQYYDDILDMDENLHSQLPNEVIRPHAVFHLDESKAAEFYELFQQILKAIRQPHIYKGEMLKHYMHVSQLFLAEMIYGSNVTPQDIKHKENLFKIFIHLAMRNFRKERQIKFYADQLNITPTYLSRTVKELSGNTVYGYLSSFLYNEICKLLKTTDMTMSEIASELDFHDQSAFTNFFKSKSGMTPLAYRKNKHNL